MCIRDSDHAITAGVAGNHGGDEQGAVGGAADAAAVCQVGSVKSPPVTERRRATGDDGEGGI